MIRRAVTVALLLVCVWTIPSQAAQKIELVDGTVIQGEVVGFDGSIYTVRTESLGTVKIEKSRVQSIQLQGPSSSGLPDLNDLRSRVASNPEWMGMIMGLQDHPDVQEVLSDPELMKAVEAGDLEKLLSSPKIQKLLQNPTVQEIGKGLSK